MGFGGFGGSGSAGIVTIGSGISGGTTTRVLFDDAGTVGESANLTFDKTNSILTLGADVLMVRDAANVLALKNGSNAQTLRIYNTTTGSKYGTIGGDNINVMYIYSATGGVIRFGANGTYQYQVNTTSMQCTTDNAADLGVAGGCWRDGYISRELFFNQTVQNAATVKPMILATGGAHTALTASTEAPDVDFNLSRTVQFATGALALQRAFIVRPPTYDSVAASTITDASTLSVLGGPVAAGNVTITRYWSATFGTVVATTRVAKNALGVFGSANTDILVRDNGHEAFMHAGADVGVSMGAASNSNLLLCVNNANVWTFNTVGALLAQSNYDFAHGTSALATNATVGFLFINSSAGAPTGVPGSIPSGQIALHYDTTNNFLYVYNGAWKKSTVYA